MDFVPLNIAFVVLHTSPLHQPGTKDAGGMNVVVLAQARELARMGHRVRMFTRRSDETALDVVTLEPGLTVVQIDAGPARLLAKGEHETLIQIFGEALLAHLRAEPADLVHAEHWYSGVAALPVARQLGIPMLQSYHSIAAAEDSPLTDGERPEAPGRLVGERMLAHEADAIVTVSEAERLTVIDRLGGDPRRVYVVTPGVDTDLFHPRNTQESADRAPSRAEALIAGRLHPLKGFDVAIAALALLPESERPVLRIIGSPPPDGAEYVQSLHDAVTAAGMGDGVIFEGALTRELLSERLRDTSVVLIPSHSETYGLVALEAAASGVPVIARATGGLCEAVSDGVTGLLVASSENADDTETEAQAELPAQSHTEAQAWAAAIRSILSDMARAAQLGADARASALRRNWEASAQALLSVYREVHREHVERALADHAHVDREQVDRAY